MNVADWRRTGGPARALKAEQERRLALIPKPEDPRLTALRTELESLRGTLDALTQQHAADVERLAAGTAGIVFPSGPDLTPLMQATAAAQDEAREATRAVTSLLNDCSLAARTANEAIAAAAEATRVVGVSQAQRAQAVTAVAAAAAGVTDLRAQVEAARSRLSPLNVVVTRAAVDQGELVVDLLDLATGLTQTQRTKMPKQRVGGGGGQPGATGVSITNAVVNGSNRLIITLSNGTIIDAGSVGSGGGTGGFTAVVTKTANYTALVGEAVLVDASAGPVTITAPSAVGNSTRLFGVKKIDASANIVTIAKSVGNLDNAASIALRDRYSAGTFTSDATDWWMFS